MGDSCSDCGLDVVMSLLTDLQKNYAPSSAKERGGIGLINGHECKHIAPRGGRVARSAFPRIKGQCSNNDTSASRVIIEIISLQGQNTKIKARKSMPRKVREADTGYVPIANKPETSTPGYSNYRNRREYYISHTRKKY